MTIKREIEKTTKTVNAVKTATTNTFSLKGDVLTLKMKVEFNNTETGLKIVDLLTDIKGYKKAEFKDSKGNVLTLFKTGFEYSPKVKKTAPIAVDPKKLDVLDSSEKDVLMAILAKLQ